MERLKFIALIMLMLPFCLSAKTLKKMSVLKSDTTIQDTSLVKAANIDKSQKTDTSLSAIESLTQFAESLNDSINVKEERIRTLESKIEKLEKQIAFADSVIARLSNDCLRKKYDEQSVKSAIHNFEQMHSPELKSKFAQLKVLLSNYGRYTKEIVTIFNEVQKDGDMENIFRGKDKAQKYIVRIKETEYYRNVYDANWTIPYLNKIIDKSIEMLESYNPRESKEMHLLELME